MVSPGDTTFPPTEPLLTMRGISKHFGGTQALADAGIEVASGEIVALLGENGAGKSTLIKILAGVHLLDAGSITYRGHAVAHGTGLRRLPIAFIHQDLGLIEWMTVAETVPITGASEGIPSSARTSPRRGGSGGMPFGIVWIIAPGMCSISIMRRRSSLETATIAVARGSRLGRVRSAGSATITATSGPKPWRSASASASPANAPPPITMLR